MVILGKVSSEPIFIITQTIIKQFYQNKQLHRQCKLNVDFSWFVTMFLCVLIPYVCYIPHVCRCTFTLRNFNVLLNFKKSKGRQKEREKKTVFCSVQFFEKWFYNENSKSVFYWVPSNALCNCSSLLIPLWGELNDSPRGSFKLKVDVKVGYYFLRLTSENVPISQFVQNEQYESQLQLHYKC